MSLYTVIKEIATKQGKSIYRIERDCGLSNGIVRRWDKSIPRADILQTVADYLDVTTSYLLNKAKESK